MLKNAGSRYRQDDPKHKNKINREATQITITTRPRKQNSEKQQLNARRVRNIIAAQPQNETKYEEENESETIDPESTCYIKEMMEDWNAISFTQSLNFTTVNTTSLKKNQQREFSLKTSCNNEEINWLVDPGRPRSFFS